MEKKAPSLKSLYKKLADLMLEDVQIGDGNYESNNFYYDEDGWNIEVEFKVEGYWNEYGDGYWTPYERACVEAVGYIESVSASFYDEVSDEDIEIPENEIDDLYAYLDKQLEDYCTHI